MLITFRTWDHEFLCDKVPNQKKVRNPPIHYLNKNTMNSGKKHQQPITSMSLDIRERNSGEPCIYSFQKIVPRPGRPGRRSFFTASQPCRRQLTRSARREIGDAAGTRARGVWDCAVGATQTLVCVSAPGLSGYRSARHATPSRSRRKKKTEPRIYRVATRALRPATFANGAPARTRCHGDAVLRSRQKQRASAAVNSILRERREKPGQ